MVYNLLLVFEVYGAVYVYVFSVESNRHISMILFTKNKNNLDVIELKCKSDQGVRIFSNSLIGCFKSRIYTLSIQLLGSNITCLHNTNSFTMGFNKVSAIKNFQWQGQGHFTVLLCERQEKRLLFFYNFIYLFSTPGYSCSWYTIRLTHGLVQ